MDAVKTQDFARTGPHAPKRPLQFPQRSSPTQPNSQVNQRAPSIHLRSPPRPVTDCDIVFAIDISQSTRGRILAEECALIENFADSLTARARGRLRIMPWDEIHHKVITVEELPNLDPAGRTDPTVLLKTHEQIELLQNCHLWFLLTDGEIVPNTVQRLARGLALRSLHGTACVIVIFGTRPTKPFFCNVSVGFSVFAVSPNCLFIFHDVETHTAYILQCKGVFNALMPKALQQLNLDKDTTWDSLPQLDYVDVLSVKVPQPIKLGTTDFQLQSGQSINLDALYSGKLSRQLENELLSNADDLKSAILTATSRGQSDAMHKWIVSQEGNTAEAVGAPRPDINGNAARLVRQAIRNYSSNGFVPDSNLRKAHVDNWAAFAAAIEPPDTERLNTVKNALNRLTLIREEGPSSPGGLSPVVSPSFGRHGIHQSRPGPSSRLLYSKGYRLSERSLGPPHLYRCCLCGGHNKHIALLLKQPPEGEETPGLPKPRSFSDLLFPLAIGKFRETDIISKLTCCEACAVFALDYEASPFNEPLSGALIFGEGLTLDDNINKTTWLNTLQRALDGRFSRESTILGCLSIIYDALDKISDPTCVLALKLARDTLLADVQMPYEIGNHAWSGRIPDVVSHYISIGTSHRGCDFIDHPFDSCTTMIRGGVDSGSIPNHLRTVALFHRLLLHFIEHAFEIQGTQFEEAALNYYSGLRNALVIEDSPSGHTRLNLPHYISLDALCENHVAGEDAIAALRSASRIIESTCAAPITFCLLIFNTINTGFTSPRQILDWFFERAELQFLFSDPSNLENALYTAAWEAFT
ncbi:MAG: hypothetical protein Q9195_006912 [Heterodermia aff. obscurata]